MHITKNTDYSLRTLMLLALRDSDDRISIEEISLTLGISRAHLMKVVNQLSNLSLVDATRGRNGGVRIDLDHADINIGSVVRQLEEVSNIVNCQDGPCMFQGACNLERAFNKAAEAFLNELDQYTLADLVKQRTHLQKIVFQRSV